MRRRRGRVGELVMRVDGADGEICIAELVAMGSVLGTQDFTKV